MMVMIRKKYQNGCCEQSTPCSCKQTVIEPRNLGSINASWSDGVVRTEVGEVPRARTELNAQDRFGTIKARWGVGRMHYRVAPGLYAVGNPGAESPVLVTANYKLSFDKLRSVLANRDAWILVLDTKGINVWCASGKGTFGTAEIVRRVQLSGLDRIVSHRKLVLPQLGAPGVSAHLVREQCGFRVIYGPVRAQDLPTFLAADMRAEPEMRRVRFNLRDRAVLIPVETIMGMKHALLAAAAILLLSGLNTHGYSFELVRNIGLRSAAFVLAAFLGGVILGPLLLPWLPGRAFSVKGAILGLLLSVVLILFSGWAINVTLPVWHLAAWALLVPAITSFAVMNFTGATTFTSLSGVLREMRMALPVQITSAMVGLGLWIAGLFLSGGHAL
jgi:hypothetical protein